MKTRDRQMTSPRLISWQLRGCRERGIVQALRLFAILLMAATIAHTGSAQSTPVYSINIVGVANGGGTSAGGPYTFPHTIGQQVQGNVSGGTYTAQLGFWPQAVPAADLKLVAAPLPGGIYPGDTIRLSLTASNAGPLTATGVQLRTVLPFGTSVQSITSTAGNCQMPDSNNIVCAVTSLGVQQAFTVEIIAGGSDIWDMGDEFTFVSELSATEPDPNPIDNRKEHRVVVVPNPGPVWSRGLEHTALGAASLFMQSNVLQISNLGSNGQDGVRIALGQADGWRATILHHMGATNRPVGSRIEWTVLGEKNGQPNQPLIYGRVERTQDGPVLYADGSLVGATTFDLEVVSNAVVIVRTSVPSGYIQESSIQAILRLIAGEFHHVAWQGLTGPQDGWCSFIAQDPAPPYDRLVLRIRPTSMTATVGKFFEVQLRGVNSGNFSLRDEAVARLGAYLQAGDGTGFQSESNRVRFLAGSNGIAQARILAPEATNTMNRCLAFHTPGIGLATPGSAVTFSASDAAETFSFQSLMLQRELNGRLSLVCRGVTTEVGRVVVELFNSTSVVETLSLSPGDLGTLSSTGRIVTAGIAETRVPVLSVVFDAPVTFWPIGLPPAGGQVATGLRIYPGNDSDGLTWSSLDRFDVETVNEPLMEWTNRIIVWSPAPTRPVLGHLSDGARPRLSFPTEAGVDYVVQFWEDLGGTRQDLWYIPAAGEGGQITVEDPQPATAPARFYRAVPTRDSLWEGLRGLW